MYKTSKKYFCSSFSLRFYGKTTKKGSTSRKRLRRLKERKGKEKSPQVSWLSWLSSGSWARAPQFFFLSSRSSIPLVRSHLFFWISLVSSLSLASSTSKRRKPHIFAPVPLAFRQVARVSYGQFVLCEPSVQKDKVSEQLYIATDKIRKINIRETRKFAAKVFFGCFVRRRLGKKHPMSSGVLCTKHPKNTLAANLRSQKTTAVPSRQKANRKCFKRNFWMFVHTESHRNQESSYVYIYR